MERQQKSSIFNLVCLLGHLQFQGWRAISLNISYLQKCVIVSDILNVLMPIQKYQQIGNEQRKDKFSKAKSIFYIIVKNSICWENISLQLLLITTIAYCLSNIQQQFNTNFKGKMSQVDKKDLINQIYDENSQEQSLFNVNPKQSKKLKPIHVNLQKRIVAKHNHWSNAQNELYLQFIKTYFDLLEGEGKGEKMLKVYRFMGQFIKTKNYAECRIHHFRMIKQYKTTEGILERLQKKIRGVSGTMEKIKDFEGLRVSNEDEIQLNLEQDEHFWSILDAKYQDTDSYQG